MLKIYDEFYIHTQHSQYFNNVLGVNFDEHNAKIRLKVRTLIQTFNKDNYVFDSLKKQDYVDFYKKEMKIRKELKYPPYYYMVSIKIVSNNYEMARDEINKVKKYLDKNVLEYIRKEKLYEGCS